MSDTPLIGLPLLEASQAQKHVTHNEALLLLDAVLHLAVISRALTAPPVSPADGDRYLVAASATGDWLGHSGQIAFREAGAWRFAIPKAGWRLWVAAESLFLLFDGTLWIDLQDFDELQNMDLLGVNTSADAANKLSVASANVLFTHVGAGQRMKINKNAAGDTASLLYQTGFSGRAEIGTAGDDDFHFKVSPDGSAWNEALVIDRTSGVVTVAAGLNIGQADTTLTRSAAGQVAVEGKRIFNDGDKSAIGCVIDGGGAAITTGVKGDIGPFTFACTIEDVSLLADQSGSIVVDIWKDSYANFPPLVADSITAAAKPTISAAVKSQDTTLTGWTTAIAIGDVLRFNVDSAASCQRVALSMKYKRT